MGRERIDFTGKISLVDARGYQGVTCICFIVDLNRASGGHQYVSQISESYSRVSEYRIRKHFLKVSVHGVLRPVDCAFMKFFV